MTIKRRQRNDAKKRPVAPRPPRRRRSPEQARAEILTAAERVLAARGPDGVGLKDVAREAGVSHGLVTHYFGTYASLVGEVFAQGTRRVRDEVLERIAAGSTDPEPLLEVLFEALSDPVTGRLMAWAAFSPIGHETLLRQARTQVLRRIADLVESQSREEGEAGKVFREKLEFVLTVAMSSACGYALGRERILRSLGHEPSEEADAAFRRRLARLLRGALAG